MGTFALQDLRLKPVHALRRRAESAALLLLVSLTSLQQFAAHHFMIVS
jgi:hypothetical protein